MSFTGHVGSAAVADFLPGQVRRRVMRRLLPYICVLYVLNFLDRVNISYAALDMTRDLGFTPAVYGFGAGVFFFGYLLLEIPGALVVEHGSARRWLSVMMVIWGIIASLSGWIQHASQFYVLRLLLGLAEAGFFPGIIVYLGHWFREEDRARALAFLVIGLPVSNLVGGPISGLLLRVHWYGLPGWRWLFLLEGLPSILFGLFSLWYLTDRPEQARWLSGEEREWLVESLAREHSPARTSHGREILRLLGQRQVLTLIAIWFLVNLGVYGFNFWLPMLVKRLSGLPTPLVIALSSLPFAAALGATIVVSASSDRTRERYWHAAVPMAVFAFGLTASVALAQSAFLAIAMMCVAGLGLTAGTPSFWAIVGASLSGASRAVAVGLITSVGSIGGFVGPYLMGRLNMATGSFSSGLLSLAMSLMLAAGLTLFLRPARAARG